MAPAPMITIDLGCSGRHIASFDPITVSRSKGKKGEFPGNTTCRDENIVGRVQLRFPVAVGHLDFSVGGETTGSTDVIDLVFLEEKFDSPGQLVGDRPGSPDDLFPIVLEPIDLETKQIGLGCQGLVQFGIFEQGLSSEYIPS